jgi:kinesin family protein 11
MQEQSKSEEQKLLADITSLVSKHVTRQRELVRCILSPHKYKSGQPFEACF